MTAAAAPVSLLDYGLPNSGPAAKIMPLIPRFLEEGWSAKRLAEEGGISIKSASRYAGKIRAKVAQQAAAPVEDAMESARQVAIHVRQAKLDRLRRTDALLAKLLDQIEATGSIDPKDLEAYVRTDQRHQDLAKELSGVALAEKLHLAKARGDATGAGFARVLLDCTEVEPVDLLEADVEPVANT